jgi:hypothetical protein
MKGGVFKRQLGQAIALVGLLGGHFGYDPRPAFEGAGQQIEGSNAGLGSAWEPNKKRTVKFRGRVGYGKGHRRRYMQRGRPAILSGHRWPYPAGLVCGRGTDWIKENRRRRAYGLPQLREKDMPMFPSLEAA